MFQASSPAVEYFAPAPAVVQAPTLVVEYVARLLLTKRQRQCFKHVAPAPAVFPAPASVSGLDCSRASSVPIASASGGAFLTNSSRVSSASAYVVSLLHPLQRCPNRQRQLWSISRQLQPCLPAPALMMASIAPVPAGVRIASASCGAPLTCASPLFALSSWLTADGGAARGSASSACLRGHDHGTRPDGRYTWWLDRVQGTD